ncbi:hypothetical protein GCM10009718_03530 [Isoptericola halotolerans]|uniref:Membrane protein n=1 Tax=Isoptericola halotolerans TaxID=300560 RepID=A0ABX2A4L6_9MICO|nr:DUF202 domain-containing protein [Isoptericola halotolerans]NOV96722.1 putative membrane protein [Isoptericola halotolerans]
MSDPADVPTPSAERGVAAERTALAWRRTLLSFMAASLVTTQVLPTVQGSRALAVSVAVLLVLTPPLWWFTAQHARHTHAHLQAPTPRLRHGRRIAVVCASTCLLGLGGVVLVLAS